MRYGVALLLALLLVLLTVTGMVAVTAAELPQALFTYDFTPSGAANALGFKEYHDCSVTYDGEGYVTFRAANVADTDPYFKFGDGHQPAVSCSDARFIVIKYRTRVDCRGEFYTNRTDGVMWGQSGSHVAWDWDGDGQWHLALVDASASWAATDEGVSFYAFRFDPMENASGGDTIDIAYIKFFKDRATADEYRRVADPSADVFYTATFYEEDGTVRDVVYFSPTDTQLSRIPSIPRKKGYTGVWAPYTLGSQDISIYPIYTPLIFGGTETESEMVLETTIPVTDPVETTEATETTQRETEAVSMVETTMAEETTVVDETTAEYGITAPEVIDTESTTQAETEHGSGCKAGMAGTAVCVVALVGLSGIRKKEE